jgi:hypothetical protein
MATIHATIMSLRIGLSPLVSINAWRDGVGVGTPTSVRQRHTVHDRCSISQNGGGLEARPTW